ncbi:LysM domain-containing protein [Actinopolymorpha sp. B11F2]|uniref:LysM peptidoglycan-binding domain-containing protein n=1 Tax=Actinopolymorpha sp. B11F2 TaxID=3160862 RepID=UPI0032E3DABC
MSSSAPVVHIDEFRSRRTSRASAPHLPEALSDSGRLEGVPRRGAAERSPARARRGPRPRLVRACHRGLVAGGPAQAPVTLTRRGRVAVLVMTLVFLALGVLGSVVLLQGASAADAGSDGGQSVRTRTVTVAPGQTLWEIAARVDPDADIRATVEEISRLNGLTSAGDLEMGQSLVVPVRSGS